MNKIMFISGSNRNGNTQYILEKLYNEISNEKQLLLLKDKNIGFCKGCLFCHTTCDCSINDDMQKIMKDMLDTDLFVIGVPNYFSNMSGLLKNFFDRLHPFYSHKHLANKKVLYIYLGGGDLDSTKEWCSKSVHGITKCLGLDVLAEYSFKALNTNDMQKYDSDLKEIKEKIMSSI